MPEIAINEDGQLNATKANIWPAWQVFGVL